MGEIDSESRKATLLPHFRLKWVGDRAAEQQATHYLQITSTVFYFLSSLACTTWPATKWNVRSLLRVHFELLQIVLTAPNEKEREIERYNSLHKCQQVVVWVIEAKMQWPIGHKVGLQSQIGHKGGVRREGVEHVHSLLCLCGLSRNVELITWHFAEQFVRLVDNEWAQGKEKLSPSPPFFVFNSNSHSFATEIIEKTFVFI